MNDLEMVKIDEFKRPLLIVVKLMVVTILIVIATILFKMAVGDYLEKNKVNIAASRVAAELRFARYYALTHRKFTAVIMPTAQENNQGGVSDLKYKACSLRSIILSGQPSTEMAQRNSQGQFACYIEDRPWVFLPKGTFLGYTNTNGEYQEDNQLNNRCNVVDKLPFPDSMSTRSIDNIRAIIFSPEGNAVSSSQGGNPGTEDTHVTIFSGFIDTENRLSRGRYDSEMVEITIAQLSGELKFN